MTTAAYLKTPPSKEVVVFSSVIDAGCYVSRKFGLITAATIAHNTNADSHINVTYSTNIAVINLNGASASAVTLTLWGQN